MDEEYRVLFANDKITRELYDATRWWIKRLEAQLAELKAEKLEKPEGTDGLMLALFEAQGKGSKMDAIAKVIEDMRRVVDRYLDQEAN